MIRKIGALGVGLILVSGCTMLSNLEKMGKTTDGMANTTDKMAKTTEGMAETTQHMLDNFCEAFRGGRQAQSEVTRSRMIDQLRDSTEPIQLKFRNSAIFFRSLEFSVWTQIMCDTDFTKDTILADGVEEFMLVLNGLSGKRPNIEPLSAGPELQTLFALGATVEQINALQVEASIKLGFTPINMLDLILEALKNKPVYTEFPERMPKWAAKVLEMEDDAFYLMRLRYTIYAMVVFDKMFDVGQMSLSDKLKLIIRNNLTLDLASLNIAELQLLTEKYLYSAIDLRTQMRAMGRPIYIDDDLRGILRKTVIKEDPASTPAKKVAERKFKEALAVLLCKNEDCPLPASPAVIEPYLQNPIAYKVVRELDPFAGNFELAIQRVLEQRRANKKEIPPFLNDSPGGSGDFDSGSYYSELLR